MQVEEVPLQLQQKVRQDDKLISIAMMMNSSASPQRLAHFIYFYCSCSLNVHQDITLHQALQTSCDASDSLEMVEHLINMQQWSDTLRKERLHHSRMCWEQHVA